MRRPSSSEELRPPHEDPSPSRITLYWRASWLKGELKAQAKGCSCLYRVKDDKSYHDWSPVPCHNQTPRDWLRNKPCIASVTANPVKGFYLYFKTEQISKFIVNDDMFVPCWK
ncbi:hypothetical protein STEG23_024280 [Scotinomys teguina]